MGGGMGVRYFGREGGWWDMGEGYGIVHEEKTKSTLSKKQDAA